MIDRLHRFTYLLGSRFQNYDELIASRSLEEVIQWSGRNRLLGFNNSAIRLRIIYSLAQASQATHFIETGTHHAATAICANQCLRLPVWSCDILRLNYLVAKLVTLGLGNIKLVLADSRIFLPQIASQLAQSLDVRPIFYLDAHGGISGESCPLVEELSTIVHLDHFIALIDDFAVPKSEFVYSTYGSTSLKIELIREILVSSDIRRVFFPSYSPSIEVGNGRTGYVVLFRSSVLENKIQEDDFPLNLLRSFELA